MRCRWKTCPPINGGGTDFSPLTSLQTNMARHRDGPFFFTFPTIFTFPAIFTLPAKRPGGSATELQRDEGCSSAGQGCSSASNGKRRQIYLVALKPYVRPSPATLARADPPQTAEVVQLLSCFIAGVCGFPFDSIKPQ